MKFENLTERIILQRLQSGINNVSGEAESTVISETTVWAERQSSFNQKNLEIAVIAGERISETVIFRIRYRAGLDSVTWRIKTLDGKLWDIVGVPVPAVRKRYIDLVATYSGASEQYGNINLQSIIFGGVAVDG